MSNFKSLNGYDVKDNYARNHITTLETGFNTLTEESDAGYDVSWVLDSSAFNIENFDNLIAAVQYNLQTELKGRINIHLRNTNVNIPYSMNASTMDLETLIEGATYETSSYRITLGFINDSNEVIIWTVTKNENNNVNASSTVVNPAPSKINFYTTSEHEAGMWTGDHTLYRKTVILQQASTADTLQTIPHGISEAHSLFIEFAGLFNPTTGVTYPLNMVGYDGDFTTFAYCYVDKTNVYFISNEDWHSGWYKVFSIVYTKGTY